MKFVSLARLGCSLFAGLAFTALVQAGPIVGSINFDGVATVNTNSLATATAFTTITNTFVDPGTQTGSYAGVAAFTPVTFTPFSFSNMTVSPLWTFVSGGLTYSFATTSVAIMTQNSGFLNIAGTGIESITGFTPTAGTFSITDTGAGPTFTFGSGVASVPDSGSTVLLSLLGLGAVGLGLVSRKDRRQTV